MRVSKLSALLLLGACAVAPQSPPPPAHDVVLHGRVTDVATGQPIAAAQVEIVGTNTGNITNDEGYYEVRPAGEIPGRVRVRATSIGYAPGERDIDVAPGRVELDFALTARQVEIDALVVEGERNPALPRDALSSRAIVTTQRLEMAGNGPTSLGAIGSGEEWNREQYAHIAENAFVSPASVPLSTFAVDVDRASYSNVRRFLNDGALPPVDAVRIEELVNYFHYDYPEPAGAVPFTVTTEVAPAPWHDGHLLLRIGLQTRRIDVAELPPSNLVFLLDVSGSMMSYDKLDLVKQAFPLLVDQLREQDRVAIVVYAGAAGVVLPSTPGSERERILGAIQQLQAGGSTAGGAGLRLAYRIARDNFIEGGNNRVILATDGDFNVGVSSDAEMIRLVEDERESGVFLSVLGFGTGNLQDAKMEQVADHGNGSFAYIDELDEARKVFVEEIGATLLTVAKDVKLQIEFNPAQVAGYRLIGYENRALEAHEFDDDSVDAGDIGAGHSVTALYEIVPVGVDTDVEIHAVSELRYQDRAPSTSAGSQELGFVRIRYKQPDSDVSRLLEVPVAREARTPSADMSFAAAVAGFGMLLRESEFRGQVSPALVRELAQPGLENDQRGYRAGFLDLVERYETVARTRLGAADE